MREDERPVRQMPRVMFTVTGVLLAAVVSMFVVRTGGSATAVEETAGSPRTVVATVPAAAPLNQASEVPVLLDSAPQAQSQTDLRRIVDTVAGNQRPGDPVTVVYADETGTFHTAENVTLPWTLTVTPEVPVNYVTASSRGSQLNCWITDAGGATVASATDFGPSATCNR